MSAYQTGGVSGTPSGAVVSGVATHGVALFVGYALCLGWLGWRLHRESEAGMAIELSHELGRRAG